MQIVNKFLTSLLHCVKNVVDLAFFLWYHLVSITASNAEKEDDFMKKFSVKKPEYESEDYDSEELFDAIFGGDLSDKW